MTRSVWHGRRPGRHAVPVAAAFVVTAGAALAAPRVTVAQAVRVTTVSAATGAAVPNALLTAVDARDTTVGVTTTALLGSRLVPVPQAGTYRLVVRRIGQRPFTSSPVVVGTRDTVAVTLRLPTAPVLLSAVRVTSGAACVGGRGHEAPEVTALWDQIRTAVRLVTLQEADSAPAAEVRRFVTRLDADGNTVLAHTVLPPERGRVYLFGTAAPETLATRGYVRRTDTTTTYTVPDGPTLLSDTFARDHCFNLVAGADSAPGLVGLAFTPTPGRRVPEIAGVLWVDSATAALRVLTFRYVAPGRAAESGGVEPRFDTLPDGTRILSAYVAPGRASGPALGRRAAPWGGGEVRFDTLPDGTWALSAWRLRTPSVEIGAVATPTPPAAGRRPGRERTAAASDAATADAATANAATADVATADAATADAAMGDPALERLPTDPPGADPPWRVDTRAGLARLAGR
ncbi:MAG TPA: carboxypeptidase-like regulatory domain-containing protein, partial [Gemmatirosa sp.]